jgi:hypothetical protein
MNGINRLYDRLTSDERFRLFFAAAARRDCEEMDRLNNTCPSREYVMDDYDFTRAKVKLTVLTLAFFGDLHRVETTLAASLLLLLVGGGESEETETMLEELIEQTAGLRMTMKETWRRFCIELGLDPVQIEQAHGIEPHPLMEFVDGAIESVLGPIKPNEDQVELRLKQLQDAFQ